MPSYRDKITHARLFEVAVQPTDTTTIRLAGKSGSEGQSTFTNPFGAGPKIWDRIAYFIGFSANAGSHTINLYGMVNGTSYPIAAWVGVTAVTGYWPMDNLTNTPYTPAPQFIEIDETANGDISLTVDAVGKSYRGFYPARAKGGDRAIEGALLGQTIVTVSATHNLSSNPAAAAGGASGAAFRGLDKIYMWDAACFYYETIATTNGSWTVTIIGTVNGVTVPIARAAGINGATKGAFRSYFYGAVPCPTGIIFTEDSAGTWTGKIDFIAKAGRGQKFGTASRGLI